MNATAQPWIAGQWAAVGGRAVADSVDPSTGKVLGQFADAGIATAEAAIDAARIAFLRSDWAHAPRLRAAVMLEFANRVERRAGELALLLAQETGKLLKPAQMGTGRHRVGDPFLRRTGAHELRPHHRGRAGYAVRARARSGRRGRHHRAVERRVHPAGALAGARDGSSSVWNSAAWSRFRSCRPASSTSTAAPAASRARPWSPPRMSM